MSLYLVQEKSKYGLYMKNLHPKMSINSEEKRTMKTDE